MSTVLFILYPVESPTIYGKDEEKSSFPIEGGI
jgi:hypothetical protein